ncbi:hypothetical protein N431DRAFT_246460 [Stipitochalara longipes BDJ]|nr:hypothetical protein N431DRAFT_246460 [Stipitochalara longipes BDJ]
MNSTEPTAALPPPPGVQSNFVNPAFNGQKILMAGIIYPILTIPFLVARLYAKVCLIKKLQIDDYMIITSLPFTIAFSILQIYQTKNGSGYHMWDITVEMFQRYWFVGGIFGPFLYGIGTMFIKASILLFYLRFPCERSLKIVTYIVLFVVCFYSLFGAFTFLLMCRPVERYWNPNIPGKCLNFKAAFLATGVFNVATDFTILSLPIWLLRPLRLPKKQKIGVTLILMTGSFVCVVSTERLANIPSSTVDRDFTWTATLGFIWIIVEMNTAIICACLPSLKTITKHHFPGSLLSLSPQVSTAPGFQTDDLHIFGSNHTQQLRDAFVDPFQSVSSKSAVRSSVQLQSVDSQHGTSERDAELGLAEGESLTTPPLSASLNRERADVS